MFLRFRFSVILPYSIDLLQVDRLFNWFQAWLSQQAKQPRSTSPGPGTPSLPLINFDNAMARHGLWLSVAHQILTVECEDACRALVLFPLKLGKFSVLRATPGLNQASGKYLQAQMTESRLARQPGWLAIDAPAEAMKAVLCIKSASSPAIGCLKSYRIRSDQAAWALLA